MRTQLAQISNWKPILFFLIINLVFVFYIFPNYQTRLEAAAEKEVKILDARPNYTFDEVQALFSDLGEKGRAIYREEIRMADMVYPLVYAVVLILLLAFLVKKIAGSSSNWMYLSLLPLLIILFDYQENFNTLSMLEQYDSLSAVMVEKGAQLTNLKWVFAKMNLGLIGLLSLLWLGKYLLRI